jgi:hypothetical protein
MGRWSVPIKGYDFEDESMVEGGLIRAGINYINDLKKDEDMLLKALYRTDTPQDSYMMKEYKREINIITHRNLTSNRLMREYIQDNETAIVSLFKTLTNHNDNIARLAEFYLYSAALGHDLERLIRYISYTPLHKKGFIQLYHNIYHEIKRAIEWYYVKDESKVTKWKFYNNPNYIGKHIERFTIKYNFIQIDITEKPIRGAAALITDLLTNQKPDIKKEIPPDNLHHIL